MPWGAEDVFLDSEMQALVVLSPALATIADTHIIKASLFGFQLLDLGTSRRQVSGQGCSSSLSACPALAQRE